MSSKSVKDQNGKKKSVKATDPKFNLYWVYLVIAVALVGYYLFGGSKLLLLR